MCIVIYIHVIFLRYFPSSTDRSTDGSLIRDDSGMVLVAGLAPLVYMDAPHFHPSGRTGNFHILVRQILEANPTLQVSVVAESRDSFRAPRHLQRRVHFVKVDSVKDLAKKIPLSANLWPDLLIVDQIFLENVHATLQAVQNGMQVINQIDTVLRGPDVLQIIQSLGISGESLRGLGWIVTLERIPILCDCKSSVSTKTVLVSAIQIAIQTWKLAWIHCIMCQMVVQNATIRVGAMKVLHSIFTTRVGTSFHDMPACSLWKLVYWVWQSKAIFLQEIGQALIGTSTLRDLARQVCR